MVFHSTKERTLGALGSRLGAFRVGIVVGQLGAHLEPKACGSLESFKKEDPTVSSFHWDLEGSFAPCPRDGRGISRRGDHDSFRYLRVC